MKCEICGSKDARIRESEMITAAITLRAHVDCKGHSQYRSVTEAEVEECEDMPRQNLGRQEQS